ncbi:MAG: hypothetical protein IJ217_04265 [Clostridia bacterium]|nr:hypothetical protein [Clostridia bacterium]
MAIFILLVVVMLALYLLNAKLLKETQRLASDEELDKVTESLPDNEEICTEIQKDLGSKCKIELDDKAKSSAYIFFLNKIILSNTESSKKNYSRVLFIAHECVHSVQDRLTHQMNFGLANIKNLYDIILLVLLLLRKGSLELIMISFLISFVSFYYRMILEADAVYRSVMVSRKYLKKRDLEYIADKYEEIVPKTIQSMYFSYIMPILARQSAFVFLLLVGRVFS